MKRLFSLTTALAAVMAIGNFSQSAAAQDSGDKYVRCMAVIDPSLSDTPLDKRTIIVKGDKVAEMREGYPEPPAGTPIVDLTASYCLPGFVDGHTHMDHQFEGGNYSVRLTRTPADSALKAATFAANTLMAGFTTVRDAGGSDSVDIALKKAIARGDIIGPRMYVAGTALSITGGHGDESGGYREDKIHQPGINEGVADGVPAVIEAVRSTIKRGADHIKFMATGGVLSQADSADLAQFSQEEMNAIVATARDHGMRVMAHAHGDEGARRATIAGVSSLEHGTYISDATFALMKKNGTYLVPTIIAGMTVAENAKTPGFYPPAVAEKALVVGSKMGASFNRALKAGVKIAFGTDAGVFEHGKNAKEFQYMVDNGMKPIEAIRSSTRGTPELLGHFDQFGSLEKGKYADIVAVKVNPLMDIKALQDVWFVMKAGKVYKENGKRVL
ncbi:MAG: amidohydrolase family protein [Rhodospirillaceae bacterium]|nr:amidohydrolase family protein [Rhodospirillaceae bacterium]